MSEFVPQQTPTAENNCEVKKRLGNLVNQITKEMDNPNAKVVLIDVSDGSKSIEISTALAQAYQALKSTTPPQRGWGMIGSMC